MNEGQHQAGDSDHIASEKNTTMSAVAAGVFACKVKSLNLVVYNKSVIKEMGCSERTSAVFETK